MVVHQASQTRQVIGTGDALSINSQTANMRSSDNKVSLLQESLVLSKTSVDVSGHSCHDTNSVGDTNIPLSTALSR